MSKSVSYLLFAACLAICTLSSGSAWRTLSGAWQGPWSLTLPASGSAVAVVPVVETNLLAEATHTTASGDSVVLAASAVPAAEQPAAGSEAQARGSVPAARTAAAITGAESRPTGALLALTFE